MRQSKHRQAARAPLMRCVRCFSLEVLPTTFAMYLMFLITSNLKKEDAIVYGVLATLFVLDYGRPPPPAWRSSTRQ